MESLPDLIFIFCILPFAVLINFFTKSRFRNLILLIFSFMILFWVCRVRLIFDMILISAVTYIASIIIYKIKYKHLKLLICLVMIGFIVVKKFFINPIGGVRSLFFGFETIVASLICMANISYLIDIYNKYVELQKNFIKFLTYVFMFPKLMFGPVIIYYKFNKQLKNRRVDIKVLANGVELFIIGFAQKIIFANEFYDVYSFVANQTTASLPVLVAWLGIAAGFLSLVFNFVGYNNMAVGLGKMFGFDLPYNFKNITKTDSITDFFERFNGLILVYLKNYIFPWGGSSYKFKLAKIILIAISYAFFFDENYSIIPAAIYFLSLVLIEKFLFKISVFKLLQYFRKILILILLFIGTIFFQQNSFSDKLGYLGSMIGMSGILIDVSFIFLIILVKFLVMIFLLFFLNYAKIGLKKVKFFRFLMYLKSVSLIILFLLSLVFRLSQS